MEVTSAFAAAIEPATQRFFWIWFVAFVVLVGGVWARSYLKERRARKDDDE